MNTPVQLRAIIVDDEYNARENLALLLREYCPQIEVVGLADGVSEAEKLLKTYHPDVVFLDIRMPSGAEGFELLKRAGDFKFFVVFVTAFRDYAVEALNANAIHYVLKPIDIEDLKKAVEKLTSHAEEIRSAPQKYSGYREDLEGLLMQLYPLKQRIAIHHAKGIKLVNTSDIEYIEADGNCSRIHLSDGSRFLDTRTLKVYEKELAEPQFLRTHRSYIVNLQRAEELIRENGNWLRLKNGKQLPVSRNRLSRLLNAITSV
jgi:two-component system LytT family response regulator